MLGCEFSDAGTEMVDVRNFDFPFEELLDLATGKGVQYEDHSPDSIYWQNRLGKARHPSFDISRIRLVSNGVSERALTLNQNRLSELVVCTSVRRLISSVVGCKIEALKIADVQLIKLAETQFLDMHNHVNFGASLALCLQSDDSSIHRYRVGAGKEQKFFDIKLVSGQLIAHRGYRMHSVTPANSTRISLTWFVNPVKGYFPAGMAQSLFSPFKSRASFVV